MRTGLQPVALPTELKRPARRLRHILPGDSQSGAQCEAHGELTRSRLFRRLGLGQGLLAALTQWR